MDFDSTENLTKVKFRRHTSKKKKQKGRELNSLLLDL